MGRRRRPAVADHARRRARPAAGGRRRGRSRARAQPRSPSGCARRERPPAGRPSSPARPGSARRRSSTRRSAICTRVGGPSSASRAASASSTSAAASRTCRCSRRWPRSVAAPTATRSRRSLREHAPDWVLDALGPALGAGTPSAPARRARTSTPCTSSPPASTRSPTETPLVAGPRGRPLERLRDARSPLRSRAAPRAGAAAGALHAAAGRRDRARAPGRERQARAAPQGRLPRDPARRTVGRGRRGLPRRAVSRRRTARGAPAAARRSDRRQPVLRRDARRSSARARAARSERRAAGSCAAGRRALRTAIPEGLRAVIEPRLERLDARTSSACSRRRASSGRSSPRTPSPRIAPRESDLGDVEVVEQLCDGLVRRQEILRAARREHVARRHDERALRLPSRALPAGRSTSGSRRRRAGASIRRSASSWRPRYAGRTMDVASELAAHFERSRDVERAIRYHARGGRARGVALRLPGDSPAPPGGARSPRVATRDRGAPAAARCRCSHELGWTWSPSSGWGDEDAARAFTRMRELAERLDGADARFSAMEASSSCTRCAPSTRPRGSAARRCSGWPKRSATGARSPAPCPRLARPCSQLGELDAAREIAERGRALGDPASRRFTDRLLQSTRVVRPYTRPRRRAHGDEPLKPSASARRATSPILRAYAATYFATQLSLRDVATTRRSPRRPARRERLGFSVRRRARHALPRRCDVQDGRGDEGVAPLRGGLRRVRRVGPAHHHLVAILARRRDISRRAVTRVARAELLGQRARLRRGDRRAATSPSPPPAGRVPPRRRRDPRHRAEAIDVLRARRRESPRRRRPSSSSCAPR